MSRVRSRGFTLIEVVVAFAILATSLGVLYEAFGGALRRSAAAGQRELAALRVDSLLSEFRGSGGLLPSPQRGHDPDTGLDWRITRKAYLAELPADSAWVTEAVTVEVSWGEGAAKSLRRDSVELVRRERT
jgi:general secretion pathway protein I